MRTAGAMGVALGEPDEVGKKDETYEAVETYAETVAFWSWDQ